MRREQEINIDCAVALDCTIALQLNIQNCMEI